MLHELIHMINTNCIEFPPMQTQKSEFPRKIHNSYFSVTLFP